MKNNLLSWINKNRDPNIAPNLKRLFAFIIDYFIGSIFVSFIPMILVSIITQEKVITVNLMKTIPFDMQLICCIVSIVLAVYYYCIIPLNPTHLGQTLGKR
ncbi:MAG: RDD family protein, partial [Anaerorhabdus sp.]